MAERRAVTEPGDTGEIARASGIHPRGRPTLSDIDRRRVQLWSTSIFVVVMVTVAIALLSLGADRLPEILQPSNYPSWVVVVLVGGLALAFLIYVIEKEMSLRKLSAMLVDERVLSAALSNRLTEISALSEVGKAINTTLDLSDVLQLILSSALELLGGTEGSIMLLDSDRETLEVVSYRGPVADAVLNGRTKVGEGIAGVVAQRRAPALIQGTELSDLMKGLGHPNRQIHSAMCVPLIRRGEMVGVLNLNETQGHRTFTAYDLSSLGLFAEHAAIAIGNARIFEEERETISQLEELDRLKNDFVATVSHELKTPVTAIIGAAKTLSRKGDTMTPDQHASFMGMIERQGTRLLRLVEDVLTTSRIDSGATRMRRELVDLREVGEMLIEELSQTKTGKGRELTLECDPERPHAWGDLTALQQIMLNLTENALKYSAPPSKVTLHVKETPLEAVIEVTDKGQGMSDEQVQGIFDRFRQVDSSSTRSAGGFGLGLYIVKNLVEAHAGHVEVESVPGVGSCFRVHLPKRASDR